MTRSTLLEPASDDATGTEAESDGTTSAEELQTTQQRALQAKSKRRLQLMAMLASQPTLAGLTLLERTPVQAGTETSYDEAVERFMSFADETAARFVEDAEVD